MLFFKQSDGQYKDVNFCFHVHRFVLLFSKNLLEIAFYFINPPL